MSQSELISVMQDAVFTAVKAAAPMLIVAMVVGLIISIFQATTQINEQTLAFVPKIVAVLLSIIVFGGFIINTLLNFITRIFDSILPYIN